MAEADGVEALALRCNEADNAVIPSAWYGPKLVGIAPQVAHARAYRIRSINMNRSWTDYRLELFPYSAENSVEFIIESIKAR